MNEQLSFERFIADQIAKEGTAVSPAGAIDEILNQAGETRQMPRPLALIKEPPMRISHNVAVGSPTVRVAAIMAATLLLALIVAGAGLAGSRLLAADGTIVVDQNGGGTFTTISDAVAEAQDGDEIVVMPGTYSESVTIDKDIILRGADRDSVIIESAVGCTFDEVSDEMTCPEGTPLYDDFWFGPGPYGLFLEGSNAQISDLTMRSLIGDVNVVVNGGAPTIERIANADDAEGGNVYVHGGSSAIIREAELDEGWVFFEEQSPATIEDSAFHAVVANTDNTFPTGGPATIRNNVAQGIAFAGSAVVEGNTLAAMPDLDPGFYGSAIDVQAGEGWLIKDNDLDGFGQDRAIDAAIGASGTISGNTIRGSQVGIIAGTDPTIVDGNSVTDGETGIILTGHTGNSPTLSDNLVDGVSARGIVIGIGMSPTLSGNVSCNNGENIWIGDNAEPVIDDTNEICADETAAE